MGLEKVEHLLAETIGLDARTLGQPVIQAAVETRMEAVGGVSCDDYVSLLIGSSAEQAALVDALVIPESWFFRDGQPFLRLQQQARDFAADRPFRALSIPCATGEEPYSIAITLRIAGLAPERVRIDAVDISQPLLDQAREGLYGQNSFRVTDLFDLHPYFHEAADTLQVIPAIRALVRFHRGNLVADDLMAGQPPYDAIFCRNLLIYQTASARQRALATLRRLLHPDGLLYVGHAEGLTVQPTFVSDGDHRSFAFRAAPIEVARPRATVAATALEQTPRPVAKPVRAARPRATIPPYRPAPPPAAPPVASTINLLEQAADLADRQQHAEAARLCEQAIREQGPSARAFKLLGVIGMATGALAQAEEHLLKAVYLDRQEADALLSLSLLARRRGEVEAAERYRRRAERARRAKEGA